MLDVKRVIVALRNPTPGVAGDGGQVTEGYYLVEGDKLTMTDSTGKPMRRPSDGEFYTHKLKPDENPHTIAGRLTKTIRERLHGDDNGFNRRIVY